MAQNVKSVCGLAIASVKTLAGVAIASVKTIVGVDNTSGGGPFDPADYGTVLQQSIGDDIPGADNDPITNWPFNTYGDDLDQVNAGREPTKKTGIMNGHAVCRNASGDSLFVVAPSTISQPCTVVIVFSTASTANQNIISGNAAVCYIDNGNLKLFANSVVAEAGGSTGNIIAAFVINGASSSIWRNGTQVATGNPGVAGYPNLIYGQYGSSGSGGAGDSFIGDLGHVLIYSGDISAQIPALSAALDAIYFP